MSTSWHFWVMMGTSWIIFLLMIRAIVSQEKWRQQKPMIFLLSIVVVIVGMVFARYGSLVGLPWWIFYPIPMLVTVFLPPLLLRMTGRQFLLYIFLSFLSGPFIHVCFSLFLGWNEYMPFWKLPQLIH